MVAFLTLCMWEKHDGQNKEDDLLHCSEAQSRLVLLEALLQKYNWIKQLGTCYTHWTNHRSSSPRSTM